MSVATSIPPPEPGDRPPLIVIAGPTASGKSAVALDLAERTGGVIINADASQLYADLRIVSARPSPADEARVLHRLYGVLDAADPASAPRWAELARAEIAAAHDRSALPILTGGTGLYLRTLLDGIAPIPPIDPAIRADVRALPLGAAHAALAAADPVAAARLAAADTARVTRALEVVWATGRTLADWQADRAGGIGASVALSAWVVTMSVATLDARIAARTRAMLAGGGIEEAARLAARRLPSSLPAMKAIGVADLARAAAGAITLAEAEAAIILATRRYAKRQRTWFRNQCGDWSILTNR